MKSSPDFICSWLGIATERNGMQCVVMSASVSLSLPPPSSSLPLDFSGAGLPGKVCIGN